MKRTVSEAFMTAVLIFSTLGGTNERKGGLRDRPLLRFHPGRVSRNFFAQFLGLGAAHNEGCDLGGGDHGCVCAGVGLVRFDSGDREGD
jgi:hypothetical protein